MVFVVEKTYPVCFTFIGFESYAQFSPSIGVIHRCKRQV